VAILEAPLGRERRRQVPARSRRHGPWGWGQCDAGKQGGSSRPDAQVKPLRVGAINEGLDREHEKMDNWGEGKSSHLNACDGSNGVNHRRPTRLTLKSVCGQSIRER